MVVVFQVNAGPEVEVPMTLPTRAEVSVVTWSQWKDLLTFTETMPMVEHSLFLHPVYTGASSMVACSFGLQHIKSVPSVRQQHAQFLFVATNCLFSATESLQECSPWPYTASSVPFQQQLKEEASPRMIRSSRMTDGHQDIARANLEDLLTV